MYRGQYDRQTPPGYSGVAFQEKNPPTPVESGAGESQKQTERPPLTRAFFSGASADRRNEVKTLPRDFSGMTESSTAKETQEIPTLASEKSDFNESLSSFLNQKFSLEELLLIGTALLLASKEDKDEVFPVFALALMLLGS